MKLYGSTRSPFSRKVMVVVHELDLAGRIEFKPAVVGQTQTDDELVRVHPLSQIPALQLDDGLIIHDSLIICEYLEHLSGTNRLIPPAGRARWQVLSKHSLGQAMLETLIRLFSERKRVADPLHGTYTNAFTAKFLRVLPALDAQCGAAATAFDLGDVAIGCALGYADFRFPQIAWRAGHASLTKYYDALADRPSMRATAPGAGAA